MSNKQKQELVFAFDVGMGSLGIAVNRNKDIVEAKSLLIDSSIASMADERERRRAYRTRQAHKQREQMLEELWRRIGESPLLGIRYLKKDGKWHSKLGDTRLEREFSKSGDDTVYNSALLRIMLLQGEELETWQIYKALRSSIQRRGYDSDVPWGTRGGSSEEDDKEESEKTSTFEEKIRKISVDSRHHFPCYYDAFQMGLWNPQQGIIKNFLGNRNAGGGKKPEEDGKIERARGYTAPREMVKKEVAALIEQAANQIPALRKVLEQEGMETLLYGASNPLLPAEYRPYPSAKRIDGLLAQKSPRFDNRGVGHCSLIPRYKVCNRKDGLFIRVNFLLGLNNFRYEKVLADGSRKVHWLEKHEIKKLYESAAQKWEKKKQKPGKMGQESDRASCFHLTKKEVEKVVEENGGEVKIGHEKIEKIERLKGRCRYSRPALAILHGLFLSGKSPEEYHGELLENCRSVEKDKQRWGECELTVGQHSFSIHKDELGFLREMADAENRVYIPQKSLAETCRREGTVDRQQMVNRFISSCASPMVRHRLTIFNGQLTTLIENHGEPTHACIELVREDFMGEKRKKEYLQKQKEGRREKREAVKGFYEVNGQKVANRELGDKQIEMLRLMKEQKYRCVYTGQSLCPSKMNEYDIDHIIPTTRGGPDALYNKVVMINDTNRRDKRNQAPCDWSYLRQNWQSYVGRVANMKNKTKKALLLATSWDEIEPLIEKYTGLAVTSHFARLARDVVCLRMGWQPGEKGVVRHISVISGGLTNKIARKYSLHECLWGGKRYYKNRDDGRHHALDAMIISYLPEWARAEKKTDFFKFPQGVDKEYFEKKLAFVMPQKIAFAKAKLSEQPLARVRTGYRYDKQRGKYGFKYEMRQRKEPGKERTRVGDYRKDTYGNLGKAKGNRGGQWYTSHKKTGEGSRTHGCLIGLSLDDGPIVRPLHAHCSPYQDKAAVRAVGCHYLMHLRRGDAITVRKQVECTQLGGKKHVPAGVYTVKKVMKGRFDIADTQENEYRIKQKVVFDQLKRKAMGEIFHQHGGEFDFNGLKVGKSQSIDGKYRVEVCEKGAKEITLVSANSASYGEKVLVNYRACYSYFANNIIPQPVLKESETFKLTKGVEVDLPDKKREKFPPDTYLVNSFLGRMKYVKVLNRQGTEYKVSCKKLAHAIDHQ